MKSPRLYLFVIIFAFVLTNLLQAQPRLEKDYSYVMEVPAVIAMESSPAHLYVLSDTEGMVVFRVREDSLQWLYSSTGMEQRGNTITADIRFAYLFGYNRRLTVLEPTSVLGVYSSTLLPEKPIDSERLDQHLYIALGNGGLGRLSLRTPASVDSAVDLTSSSQVKNASIIDLEASASRLFALSEDRKLYVFNHNSGKTALSDELTLSDRLDRIFLVGRDLYGSDESGNIYEIDPSGELAKLGSINEPVKKLQVWKDWLLIQGTSNRVWTSYQSRSPLLWKDDSKAGNFFTVTQGQLWLSEYNQISRIVAREQPAETKPARTNRFSSSGVFKLKSIDDQVVPFPKPLLLPLSLESNYPPDQVKFAYESDVKSARIKGSGLYWQPSSDDVGQHRFKIIATASDGQTDSTIFRVEVRSFNTPPRFAPLRPITIPVGEPFTLPVRAMDPDGMDQDLIRYLGVDLPEGSSVDERTGEFNWKPGARQVGENKFRVIATDQYGAASSADITIRVIETGQDTTTHN